jgi:peptide/nickel transport system substrate-binding protein
MSPAYRIGARGLGLGAALALILALLGGPALADRPTLIETPSLAAQVKDGTLPPVAQRVPDDPLIATPAELGQPGGDLRLLMAGAKDTRMMEVYGYARLVGYTPALELKPDILAAVDNENDRRFTLHLRKGHKWSDGQPFTAEDFRYWFEDVAGNPKLSPSGLPQAMLVDGKPPTFEVIDPQTVRYTWPSPNPLFLAELAAPEPLYIYAPSHYLKRFHGKYADEKTLAPLLKQFGARNWSALHTKLGNMYRMDNPDLPSLAPWVPKTRPPADRFVFERNPYFHRIDPAGRQLPYINRAIINLADSKIIPAKTGAGEADLQARYLRFDNYTFLKEAERRNDYRVRLWRTAEAAHLALYPDLNGNDPVWRKLLRDVRFRRALSLAIDRHEINQVIYYGLAVEGQNTVLPGSPLYKPEYREAWAKFDLDEANRLLDEIGLTKRQGGIRLLPDGRPLDLIVENSGELTEQADVLELVADTMREAGIRIFNKPEQLESFRRRVFAGETVMSIDKGWENGLATPDMPPSELAPTEQIQLEWPKWGQYIETKQKAGEAPDIPEAQKLYSLYQKWFDAPDRETRAGVWHEMLAINSDQLFTIGIVAGVLQPVVITNRLRNVPAEGIYNWDPGAFFGIYHPDQFWFADPGVKSASAATPK